MRAIEVVRPIMVSAASALVAGCSVLSDTAPLPADATPVGVSAQDDAQPLADARRFFDGGNPGLALSRIEVYLERNPQSASGHNLAGAILDSIGRYDLAESHYKKALALQTDYLPAINNFGLSKLQRARADARLDLEQEADALLARAEALSSDPEALLQRHQAFRAALPAPRPAAQPMAIVVGPAQINRFTWLERRSANYTFVVTHGSSDAATAFDLDPAIALVSPGAMLAATRIALAPISVRWQTQPMGSPFLIASARGVSRLSLNPSARKSLWYNGLAGGCHMRVQPSPCAAGSLPANDSRADVALSARANSLLQIAAVQQ